MQLHALNQNLHLISAAEAHKHIDYTCIECQGQVRLRAGMHRRAHFYHLNASSSCRQNGKSMEHLQVQYHMLDILPKGEGILEYPFPTIGRIADVVWKDRSLIFEVQCSPISQQEVLEREKDYASIGFSVVWILHDAEFNQWRLSAAENLLLNRHRYYTNINAKGEGIIYDQYEVVEKGVRLQRFGSLEVNLAEPGFLDTDSESLFSFLRPRFSLPCHFYGDLVHMWSTEGEEGPYFQEVLSQLPPCRSFVNFSFIERFFLRPYRAFFHILLDKTCR